MSVRVVAEIGSVHDGSLGNALRLVDLAAESGADAVKFQIHCEGDVAGDGSCPDWFTGEDRASYFRRTGFTIGVWGKIKAHAESIGLGFLTSVFSLRGVEVAEAIGVAEYKIPSGQVTNLPLLRKIAETGNPVLLSTGMSTWAEMDAAMECFPWATVLQCTSEYPCAEEHVGLNVLKELRVRYGCPVGLSDHTLTNYASFAAVVLGATVIERHLTFSRKMYGSDAGHSLEPAEFAEGVRGIRSIERMLAAPINKDEIGHLSEVRRVFLHA